MDSDEHADLIVRTLRNAAFPTSAISLLVPSASAAARDEAAPCDGPVALGNGAMSASSGALAWLVGLGRMSIAGVGALVAAGPLFVSLSAADGYENREAGLRGIGLTERDSQRYEDGLRAGKIVVSVCATTAAGSETARRLLETGGAHDITAVAETRR